MNIFDLLLLQKIITDPDSGFDNFTFQIPEEFNYSISEGLKLYLIDQGIYEYANDGQNQSDQHPFIVTQNGILTVSPAVKSRGLSKIAGRSNKNAQFTVSVTDSANHRDDLIVNVCM